MSLLQRTEAAGETRFGMLETIREFSLERLAESGEADVVADQHAAWCIQCAASMRGAGRLSQGRGLAALEAEAPNLRAALRWLLEHGEVEASQRLTGQLAEFWLRHSHIAEGEMWLERALAADADTPTAARVTALVGLSMMQWQRRDLARAERLLDEAEAMARTLGDAGALAYTRLHQGYVALYREDFDLAAARGEEVLSSCAAIPQGFSCHGALWLLARAALARGQNDRAIALYERLLASARAEGDEVSIANGLCALGMLAAQRDEWDRMVACYAEAAMVCRAFGDRPFAGGRLDGAAAAAVALGRLELAVRLYAAADVVRLAVGITHIPGDHHQVAPQDHERALATARATLGPSRFAAMWAAGAALSLDEAIAEVSSLAHSVDAAARGDHVAPTPRELVTPAGLTPREHDVLRLLASGMTDKEIAAALAIGRRTVSSHVEAIRAKLDAPSRTAAVAIAMRDRLV